MTRPHRIGWIVLASVMTGLIGAGVLTLGVFGGAREHVISGVALLAFAAGWAVLGWGSARWTDQPQRWAKVSALLLAGLGVVFLVWPRIVEADVVPWGLPPMMLALALWMGRQAQRHLRSRARWWIVNPLLLVIELAAVAATVETVREHLDRTAYPMHGTMVAVGGDRLHIDCTGTGSPIVVLIPGAGETSSAWSWIAPAVARETRVCVYDRAGRGASEGESRVQDGIALATELHNLLEHAHATGPLVLVGHSFGGLYARVFAAQYPVQVAGMVLLDATSPDMFTQLAGYPAFYEGYRRLSALFPSLARFGVGRVAYRANFDHQPQRVQSAQRAMWATARLSRSQRDEWAAAPTAMQQAGAVTSLGARPLVVITAGRDAQDGWLPMQDAMARLSTNSVHRVLSNAVHEALVDTEGPAAVSSQAIHDVVMAVRNGQPLRQP